MRVKVTLKRTLNKQPVCKNIRRPTVVRKLLIIEALTCTDHPLLVVYKDYPIRILIRRHQHLEFQVHCFKSSSDKDLIGIFTNPMSNKSHSLINQGSSQKENTSSDARLSDYSTAIESGNSSSAGNNYTTDYQCRVHNPFGALGITRSRRLLFQVVLYLKNE